jgi:hypothetical protein
MLKINVEFLRGAGTDPGGTIDVASTGLAILGNDADGHNLTADLPTGSAIQLYAALQCYNIPAGGNVWRARVQGQWIDPTGFLVKWHTDYTELWITDSSVPGSYNKIRYDEVPINDQSATFNATTQNATWYTAGAPL